VSRRTLVRILSLALAWLAPATAAAQQAPPPDGSGAWIVVGGGSTTVLSDCPDCTGENNYRHAGGLLINAGVSLNRRADVGAEVLWVPSTAITGDEIRTTFVMAVGQFRPWVTRGFFLKGGAGMAFVRNWVVDLSGNTDEAPPFTSKALAVVVGAGWEWLLTPKFGFELFGSQHVGALGDIQSSVGRIENVVGNFWTAGGGIVFRP